MNLDTSAGSPLKAARDRARRGAAAAALLLVAACSSAQERSGELVIAFSTDLAIPDQIDNVRVQVQVRGQTYLDNDYPVGATDDDNQVPATLTIAAGQDPSTPVTIRVAGQKLGQWRTLRETTTTVPPDRSALLRMPVQWLCDGKLRTEKIPDGAGGFEVHMLAGCEDEGNTCIAGQCRPKNVDSALLPDFTPRDVFGGSSDPDDGTCFDTIRCMDQGRVLQPDSDCTIARPPGDSLNIALRVPDDGICDATRTACFVPLDAESEEGWARLGGGDRLQITPGACEALRDRRASALYASDRCPPKRASMPPCGPWSSVGRGGRAAPVEPSPQDVPKPRQLLNLLQGGSSSLCCPLMGEAGMLYTCLCARKSDATIVSVDPLQDPATWTSVAGILPAETRDDMRFAASLYAGAVFWHADREVIRRTALPGSGANDMSWRVGGAIFERTSLVASSAGVFALASGVTDAQGAPVQMLRVAASGTESFDTGGTQPVYQFGQDDESLYLAVDVDEDDGTAIQRTTRVVRMDKATGARTTILDDRILTLQDRERGGFTGVTVGDGVLFAIYEGAPDADGVIAAEVLRVDLAAGGGVTRVYETTLDRALSQLALVGTFDGAALLSRIELTTESDGSLYVRSSTLIAVPAGSGAVMRGAWPDFGRGPRVLADFARDFPGPGVVADDASIYWLNSSGRLFSLPRTALQ